MFPKAARPYLAIGMIVLACLPLFGCSSNNKKSKNRQPALKAQVLTVTPQTATVSKNYAALLRSRRQVKIVARVPGFLKARYYNEGAYVKKGTMLFTIEQAPYKATVEQRKANLASAKAKRYNAQLTFNRTARLYKSTNGQGTSKQNYDNDLASLKMAKAAVQQAKAALDQAQINFNYTHVQAPVDGMISLRKVNVGNLVQSGQQLATITPLNPIEARFSLPVRDAAALRHQRRRHDPPPVTAVLRSPGERQQLTGRINFLASHVNRQTSTVLAQATFNHNAKGLFLPGQFVRVVLKNLRMRDVMAVPQDAVTQGQEGSQVYVLGKNNKARSQQVDLGVTFTRKSKRHKYWSIVTKGLKKGDRVVVNHIASVKAGERIKPQPVGKNNPHAGGSNRKEQTRR
jgi:membrane fusion protein (multidrug efflux system)